MLRRDVEIDYVLDRLKIQMHNIKYDIKENTEVNAEDIDMERINELVRDYNDIQLRIKEYTNELNDIKPYLGDI